MHKIWSLFNDPSVFDASFLTVGVSGLILSQVPSTPMWDITSLSVFTVLVAMQFWLIGYFMKEKKKQTERHQKELSDLRIQLDKVNEELKNEIRRTGK